LAFLDPSNGCEIDIEGMSATAALYISARTGNGCHTG
jgi:hypothetical protein